jgi:hypothetical protein
MLNCIVISFVANLASHQFIFQCCKKPWRMLVLALKRFVVKSDLYVIVNLHVNLIIGLVYLQIA